MSDAHCISHLLLDKTHFLVTIVAMTPVSGPMLPAVPPIVTSGPHEATTIIPMRIWSLREV